MSLLRLAIAVAVVVICSADDAWSQTGGQKPDGFSIGSFTFKPGGRIKLDIIRDFKPIGSTDFFDPRTIPVPESEGVSSRIHARETRLLLDVRGPAEGRELRMYVEGDFYGSGNALRLRHAFASYGGLLAGQYWSTFMDEDNIPNTIDLETPSAYAFVRQAQLRWTRPLTPRTSWSVAVEDNASEIAPPEAVPGQAEYPMPAFVGRLRFAGSRSHAQVSGFLGRARFRPSDGEPDDVALWGVLVSGKVRPHGRDSAYAQIAFGDGIGRYRGGIAAAADESGQMRAIHAVAMTAGYEHYWAERVSSNGVYAVAVGDNAFAGPTFNRRIDYGAFNMIYWFLKDRAWIGVEYLYGRRELQNAESGTAHRVQSAVRVNFP